MLNATFTVTVQIDDAALALEAKRRGYTLERAREAILSDVECRLVDSIRNRDCVARVGSEMQPAAPRVDG